jgi:hypothetical protein
MDLSLSNKTAPPSYRDTPLSSSPQLTSRVSSPCILSNSPRSPAVASSSLPILMPRASSSHAPPPANFVKTLHPVPHPDEIVRPARGQHIQGFYVVFRGRQCGIFYTWYVNSMYSSLLLIVCRDEDDVRTTGLINNCQQKFPNWQAAITAYTNAYNEGDIVAYPELNSRWWTEPVRIYTNCAADTSTDSEEALWDALADEDAAARIQLEQCLGALNLE